ncbi:TetR family transcriptional regulator [Actinophytocola xanthii]|uniref:TetR family transcriptional regulator n=2 Tax=Actinophytocola xanthii TaxID=1912961 RepID=A0A1Q8CWW0_9PSEU|nr:TetR/AcrR family transcriptional regulator [Actinophytocola xanthii]OLF18857.1 TetR family transcriptional regulator [Actinophytocola xanthii]
MRADARRNRERILTTAREAFAEHGVEVPLDDIARRARVGPGTLYRHFPNRDALVEAVYREEIGALSARAYALVEELPPEEALAAWFREQVGWVRDSSGLAMTLKAAIDRDSETFAFCKKQLREAVAALLEPARAAGAVRANLEPSDLLRLGHGVATACEHADGEGIERLLSVVLAGLRP